MSFRSIRIAPSILAADFGHLADEVQQAVNGGADWIHVDVMDGHFVPNLTIGAPVVAALRKVTDAHLDVHLMIEHPERLIQDFAQAGADTITVHAEASVHLHRTIQSIKELGKRAGVSLNPHTPESVLDYVLEDLDLVLVMSVNPGFGGQRFIPRVLPKIKKIRERIDACGAQVDLEVDGGIKPGIAMQVVQAGADVLVAGSAIFSQGDYAGAIAALREDASRGLSRLGATSVEMSKDAVSEHKKGRPG